MHLHRGGQEIGVDSECLQQSVKHGGGSVTVCDCAVGELVKTDGFMNAE